MGLLLGLALLLGASHTQLLPAHARSLQAASLGLVAPAACPPAGCAAGQSLNLRLTFDLARYQPQPGQPNVQVCLYLPAGWSGSTLRVAETGLISGQTYASDLRACEPAPQGYAVLGGVSAGIPSGVFGDALDMTLRLSPSANGGTGTVLARILENDGSVWTRTQQALLTLRVIPTAPVVYVAGDAMACGGFSPCYLNSADDLSGGLGTGLKDAIDAVDADAATTSEINILGAYTIKSQTVLVDRPVTLQGLNGAMVTYSGSICDQPMLKITSGGALRNLFVNDGSCNVSNRDLLLIDSSSDVLIENNTLTGGHHAIRVLSSNQGKVTVRFNHVQGNDGYALLNEGSGEVFLVANNLYGNRQGAQVDCNNHGSAEHNFWGWGTGFQQAVSQCAITPGKVLGAAGLRLDGVPGISAARLSATGVKTYAFGNRLAFERSGTGNNFDLYVVEHGFGSPQNIPFTGGSPDDLIPCSSYWDIFLADGAAPSDALILYFRYDLTSGCSATIESSSFCASGDMASIPLWWYDPAGNATAGWDTTGQRPAGSGAGNSEGQETACLVDTKELKVVIDDQGRPGLNNDLSFTPFVVGLPRRSAAVVLTRFEAQPRDSKALIQWQTASEVNTAGFYLQRSNQPNSGFVRLSNWIGRRGSAIAGASYEYEDSGLTNGQSYYYRLEIVTESQDSLFSGVISVVPGLPTPTLTLTASPSATPSISVTPSLTPTRTLTRTSTQIPTWTRTPTRVLLPTRTRTPTPTRTLFPSRTPSQTPQASGTTTPGSRTPLASPSSASFTATSPAYPGGAQGSATAVASGEGYPSRVTATSTEEAYPPARGTPEIPPSPSGEDRGTPLPGATSSSMLPGSENSIPTAGSENTGTSPNTPIGLWILLLFLVGGAVLFYWRHSADVPGSLVPSADAASSSEENRADDSLEDGD